MIITILNIWKYILGTILLENTYLTTYESCNESV